MRAIAAFVDAVSLPFRTRRQQVIVLGDSYTSAYGVTGKQSWAAIYADRLGCDLANLAMEGATSEALVSRKYAWPSGRSQSQLAEALALVADAPPGNVRAVAMGIGINDWMWLQDPETSERCALAQTAACDELFRARLASLEDNVNTALTELQAALEPGTRLIVMTYCLVWNAAMTDAVNSVIRRAVSKHEGAILADLRTPFDGREDTLLQDTVHPSIAGHAVIADVFGNATRFDQPNDERGSAYGAPEVSEPRT